MRSIRAIFPALAILMLLRTTVAWADGLDLEQLPASVEWAVHVDIDAAKQASWADVAAFVLVADEENKARLRAIHDATEIDLMKDVTSLTFFGEWSSPEECVVAVHGELHIDKLAELISEAPEYAPSQYGDHTLHSFRPKEGEQVTVYLHDASLAVLSRNIDHLKSTVDVLSRDATSLSESAGRDIPSPRAGTILQLLVIDLSEVKEELAAKTNSPVARLVESGAAYFGEEPGDGSSVGEQTFVTLTIRARSADVAEDVRDVMAGVVALGKLHFHGQDEIQDAMDAVVVLQDEDTVRLDWRWPTRALIFAVQREIIRRAGNK